MSVYSPERIQPFKSSLIERSLERSYALQVLDVLAGLLPREQADDLGVIVGRVDVVRPAGRGHHVEQLRQAVQDLASARVAAQGEQLAPQLAREHDRRGPRVLLI